MNGAEAIASLSDRVHADFEARTRARDQALAQCRLLTRHAANAIRAIHRDEYPLAHEHLAQAAQLAGALKDGLTAYPDLFHAGYTQDAIKEFVEATLVDALVRNQPVPLPDDLGVNTATYLNGLAEVTGELRRRCLDILRQGYSQEAERLMTAMDEIYTLLVTVDYPDAITNGLRRQTDVVRGIVERTRADLTLALREHSLMRAILHLSGQLDQDDHADDPRL